MRTNNYLWAMLAAATLTLTGCGSEENGITEPMPQGKTAQLELRLTGSGVSTKDKLKASMCIWQSRFADIWHYRKFHKRI